MDKGTTAERYVSAGIHTTMYTIVPMLAFLAWVIVMPIILFGGMMTSVNDAQGTFQTLFIFSLPMLLFFAAIPILLQVKKGISLKDLGLQFVRDKKNIILLLVNSFAAIVIISRIVVLEANISEAVPIIIQLCAIGISDEILCRGIIYHEIENGFHSKIAAVIVSSIIFAFLFHSGDTDLANLVIRFPLGIIFAALRCYTGNVYNGIVMHIWYNSLMFIL